MGALERPYVRVTAPSTSRRARSVSPRCGDVTALSGRFDAASSWEHCCTARGWHGRAGLVTAPTVGQVRDKVLERVALLVGGHPGRMTAPVASGAACRCRRHRLPCRGWTIGRMARASTACVSRRSATPSTTRRPSTSRSCGCSPPGSPASSRTSRPPRSPNGSPTTASTLDEDTVEARLSYLVEHGNLARSPRETEARSLSDYLRNRARYQLSQRGELVHRHVEELLGHSEAAREVSSEMLGGILAGLQALARHDAADDLGVRPRRRSPARSGRSSLSSTGSCTAPASSTPTSPRC